MKNQNIKKANIHDLQDFFNNEDLEFCSINDKGVVRYGDDILQENSELYTSQEVYSYLKNNKQKRDKNDN